jgi:hypothetical protein
MRSLIKAGLLAAAFVLACTGSARASTMEVKVPFAFMVQGHTMPAGQYWLNDEGNGVVQMRAEKNIHANMFVLTMPASGRDPSGDTPVLTFKHQENQYRLTGIWESATRGRVVHQ